MIEWQVMLLRSFREFESHRDKIKCDFSALWIAEYPVNIRVLF